MLRSLLSLRRPTHDYCSWMQTIPPPSAPTLAPAVRNRQIAVAMDPLSLSVSLSHSLFLSPGIYSLALQPSTALLNPSSSATAHVSLSYFLLVGPPPATLPGFLSADPLLPAAHQNFTATASVSPSPVRNITAIIRRKSGFSPSLDWSQNRWFDRNLCMVDESNFITNKGIKAKFYCKKDYLYEHL